MDELKTIDFTWTSEGARKVFEDLAQDRRDLAVKMGLAPLPDGPSTASTLKERPHRVLRSPEAYARARQEYDLAVKPITDQMVHLVSRFTVPRPIVIEK